MFYIGKGESRFFSFINKFLNLLMAIAMHKNAVFYICFTTYRIGDDMVRGASGKMHFLSTFSTKTFLPEIH